MRYIERKSDRGGTWNSGRWSSSWGGRGGGGGGGEGEAGEGGEGGGEERGHCRFQKSCRLGKVIALL